MATRILESPDPHIIDERRVQVNEAFKRKAGIPEKFKDKPLKKLFVGGLSSLISDCKLALTS